MRRSAANEQVLVALNFSESEQQLELPFARAGWTAELEMGAKLEENLLTLPPHGFAVWRARF
jgi:hypothetical protein